MRIEHLKNQFIPTFPHYLSGGLGSPKWISGLPRPSAIGPRCFSNAGRCGKGGNMNNIINQMSALIDGKVVVNTTPHALNFLSSEGDLVVVPTSVPEGERTSPYVVNARAVEQPVGDDTVTTVFVGTPEGEAILDAIEAWAAEEGIENLRIIGSIIAAQAYPGRVLGMCPAPGYERVAPAEKRMTAQKFTVYVK